MRRSRLAPVRQLFGRPHGGGHPEAALSIEHRVVRASARIPDDLVPPHRRRLLVLTVPVQGGWILRIEVWRVELALGVMDRIQYEHMVAADLGGPIDRAVGV